MTSDAFEMRADTVLLVTCELPVPIDAVNLFLAMSSRITKLKQTTLPASSGSWVHTAAALRQLNGDDSRAATGRCK